MTEPFDPNPTTPRPPELPPAAAVPMEPHPGTASFAAPPVPASAEDQTPAREEAPAPAAAAVASPGDDEVSRVAVRLGDIRRQLESVFLGQPAVLDEVLACLVAGGHMLIEGKPGLGKTHLVLALAGTFGGTFGRIQFTPDLMPTDVTGHSLWDMRSQSFHLRRGPVFVNMLLADEINRAPAKTQAALLEVMQEQQVTLDGETLPLDPPFMVLATQNPIEQEGTYPLPEAQLDRFLVKVLIDYPEAQAERQVVSAVAAGAGGRGLDPHGVRQVVAPADVIAAQQAAAAVRAVDTVVDYAVRLVEATRQAPGLNLGAGTRGAIGLIRMAKAYALLGRRGFAVPDDVKKAALPVLRHRVIVAPELAISGRSADDVLLALVESVEAPRQ